MSNDTVAVDNNRRRQWVWPRALPGLLALGLSLLGLVGLIVGISLASSPTADDGAWATATVIAYLTNALTAAGALLGLVAIILRRGRAVGIAGLIIGVLANPFLLVSLFSLFGGSAA